MFRNQGQLDTLGRLVLPSHRCCAMLKSHTHKPGPTFVLQGEHGDCWRPYWTCFTSSIVICFCYGIPDVALIPGSPWLTDLLRSHDH